MFAQKSLMGAVAFAFALTATGLAFAEQPTRGGYRDSVVLDSCAPVRSSGTSYRDAAARVESPASASRTAVASGGYRDAYGRTPVEQKARAIALSRALVCHN